MKKKILILAMSCQDPFFMDQVETIKNTWAKPIIDGKYDNIEFLSYVGYSDIDKHKINKNEHMLKLRVEDDIQNTYKKTYYALSLLKSKNYDYIFRTNTSTYVNVPLLDAFVQSLEDDTVLWTSELYSLSESFVPYPLYLYGRGNGLLMSRNVVDIILKEGMNFIYMEKCDDWIIGNILNSYWMKQGENYLDHIKSYKHGWYKCINTEARNNNSICQYFNDSQDYNFLNQFLTIQIKRYRERHMENDNYNELNSIFVSHNEDVVDWQKVVQNNMDYSRNPNVFIGSLLGYMSYEAWLKIDKQQLYMVEINNKASDDAEHYKPKKMLL